MCQMKSSIRVKAAETIPAAMRPIAAGALATAWADDGRDPLFAGAPVSRASARMHLHALHPAAPGQETAATGFALALIATLMRRARAPVLWVQDARAATEVGVPYGLGFSAFGLAPEQIIVAAVAGADAVLAAAEMGLDEAGLAGVIAELPPRLPADMLKRGKRLSLRCERRQVPCFLLHATAAPVEAPVATRWRVASRRLPATATPRDAAPDFTTAFDATLDKNRFGALGSWSLAWRTPVHLLSTASAGDDHVASSLTAFRFEPVETAAPARALAADAADRPLGAAVVPIRAA